MTTAQHEAIILGDGAREDDEFEDQRTVERDADGNSDRDSNQRLRAVNESEVGQRWTQIQAQFVDDPREAVGQAHQLVGELVQRIADGFAKERSTLEKQWSQGDEVSTEDLRVCLQHYRAFFSRLVPSVKGLDAQR